MKKNILQKMIFGAALLIAAGACTQDELAEDGNTLPEGKYPLEIASVSLSAEVTDEPWGASHAPQTRVGENANGNSSAWERNGTEQIGVQIGSGTAGTYTLNSNSITGNPPAYWLSTQPNQSITAWYPADAKVSLANQKDELAYVLTATATANFNSTVALDFAHSLAKIRVKLTGGQAEKVQDVRIRSYTECTHTKGEGIKGSTEGWITMKPCTYKGIGECWEANVVPEHEITAFQVNGVENELFTFVTPKAGKRHDITINVDKISDIDFSDGDVTISENGQYRVTGDNSGKNIIIKGPANSGLLTNTIILENTTLESINVSHIQGPSLNNTTLIIKGNVTIKRGITVNCNGGEITVKGTVGSKLVITAPDEDNPAIGTLNDNNRVALTIEDATIEATGAAGAAVIGTSNGWQGNKSIGDITIKNSNLTLKAVADFRGMGNPAVIGTGVTDGCDSGTHVACGNITIYLKDGQSKEDFLQNLKGDYNEQVGVGNKIETGIASCGSIIWYNSDGSPAN